MTGPKTYALLPVAMYLKTEFDRLKISTQRMLPYWIAAALTALVSVLYTRVFGWSEKVAFGWCDLHPYWGFVLIPSAMLTSMLLARFFSPHAAGSGIPQLIAAVEAAGESRPILKSLLGPRMIFMKFAGSCICVAGGGVSGREGPTLQIAAGIFYWVHRQWSKFDRHWPAANLQPMILAGGAAGLAAAFNTPIGGVMFAIEELAKVHISQIRTYVFHAVIFAGLMAQGILGNYLYLGQLDLRTPTPLEAMPVIFCAAIIGIFGAAFGKACVVLFEWRSKRSFRVQIAMTVACGMIVAGFAILHGRQAIGSGREVIVDLLSKKEASAPLTLAAARGLGNLATYSGGVIGGIFAPALATGAALGSFLASLLPQMNPQVWVIAGMIAFLTGVTRTPFTSLILVMEMSGTHSLILSAMLAAIVANSAAKLVDSESFYERMARKILA